MTLHPRILALFAVLISLLSGCVSTPTGIVPVNDFSLERYLGTWHEVARLDHSFERGLSHVSAQYSLNDDGSVQVINRGWNDEDNQWKEAIGVAKFVDGEEIGHLKVSFFGPFYGSYVVFYLEEDYSAAVVSGYNRDYLWILAREPDLPAYKLNKYVRIAQSAGFDTEQLLFPFHGDLSE